MPASSSFADFSNLVLPAHAYAENLDENLNSSDSSFSSFKAVLEQSDFCFSQWFTKPEKCVGERWENLKSSWALFV